MDTRHGAWGEQHCGQNDRSGCSAAEEASSAGARPREHWWPTASQCPTEIHTSPPTAPKTLTAALQASAQYVAAARRPPEDVPYAVTDNTAPRRLYASAHAYCPDARPGALSWQAYRWAVPQGARSHPQPPQRSCECRSSAHGGTAAAAAAATAAARAEGRDAAAAAAPSPPPAAAAEGEVAAGRAPMPPRP